MTTLVNPFIGTGGTSGTGLIDDFPGASAPFGMVQWSPDTPSAPPSGGYLYRDTAITGFSINHLNGAGCPVFGDFAMLPTVGAIGSSRATQIGFDHRNEEAAPGFYAVTLANGVSVELAATRRAGIGRFTFPATPAANISIDTSSDQAGNAVSDFNLAGNNEIDGSVRSGGFCGLPNAFHAYVAIRFDRPFNGHGTWRSPAAGGWVTFDASRNRTVNVRVGLSYTSVDEARKNLSAEPARDLESARAETTRSWARLLSEVRVSGGTRGEQQMLYTMLYHALLTPTLFSDADGSYRGPDGNVHRAAPGHDEYTNFSGWDVYRTQIPLIALLAPRETSDMMQSLVDMARVGGWLPKWPVAGQYTGEMGGDSAAPMIAEAYAFGARDFDQKAALQAMLKNAGDLRGEAGAGWYRPRPGLDDYLREGFVSNSYTTNGSPLALGTSVTLEYAIDDFAIAQFARELHRQDVYTAFAQRAMNWTNVFDSANHIAAARDAEGAFVHLPITGSGQAGFQEGTAAQYTWMVPQSMTGLVNAMGGPQATIARLDTFFTQLNGGMGSNNAWFGNEPSLGSPWTYLYAGAPYKADAVNRQVLLTLYGPTPDGIPGNDDLGTMSAWWIWNAIGLYPLTPGTPVLLSEASLFTHVSIASPSGRTIEIDAPGASDAAEYLTSVRINGAATNRSWVRVPLRGRLALDESVSVDPNTSFGASIADVPPSYEYGAIRFPPATLAGLQIPRTTIDVGSVTPARVQFSFTNGKDAPATGVTWEAQVPAGFTMQPARGEAELGGDAAAVDPVVATSGAVAPGIYNIPIRARASNGARLPTVTAVLRVLPAAGTLRLAYVANANDNAIVPIDPRTLAFGNPIKTGAQPVDIAVSKDGSRAYVADRSGSAVSVVDTMAEKTVAVVRVGMEPAAVRLSPNGKTIWVANYDDNTVQSIDTATLQAGEPIAVGSGPAALAVAPDGSTVYAVDQTSNDLAVIDVASARVVKEIPLGGLPAGIALSPDGSRAYVTNSVSSSVSVIDTQRLTNVAQIHAGAVPQGIAVSPSGDLAYVGDSASSVITPIDLRSLKALPPIEAGISPMAVAFADATTVFAATAGDGACVAIDVATGKVRARIAIGNAPAAIGFAP